MNRVVDLHASLTDELAIATASFQVALGSARTVAVAFSGGVDSTVVLALSARLLGVDKVVAVLGVSASLARAERAQARETAAAIGVRLVEVTTHELDDEGYVENRGDRCYFCKRELYTRAFADAIAATGCDSLLNGDTADDHRRGDRPGRRAATELGVRSPLAEAGIGKEMVRALARALGLQVWDKPSAPCLASRVSVNIPVTRATLARIEQAEAGLRDLGLRELRVRHLGASARVELGPAELSLVQESGLQEQVVDVVHESGYESVELAGAPLRRA